MRTRILLSVGLILLASGSAVRSQDVIWRPANPASGSAPVTLGQPRALAAPGTIEAPPRMVRGQIGEPPPPPQFIPGAGGPPVFVTPGGPGGADMYNRGVVTHDGDLGGFWSRAGDKFKRCWDDVSGGASGAFQSTPDHQMFQSDHRFDVFSSPVTNPFFFIDPRASTEIRPFFIWQHTPSANPTWNGGNNFDYGIAGSVAITPHISVVFNRLGFTTINPRGGDPDIQPGSGASEVLFGPKLTFGTEGLNASVFAIGLTFDVPAGSGRVLQNTGHTALVPYFSYAQNFGRSSYGSFNFMNSTGYAFRTDNTRSESLYSSFHLDYEIGKRFYPLVEANWRHYTRNGGARALNFEGNDLANFGSQDVAGRNELTLAIGTRIVITKNITWGIAGEFNVLSNGDGRHLDQFRLTTDFIFRY